MDKQAKLKPDKQGKNEKGKINEENLRIAYECQSE